jgi:hypothetical protein
MATVAAAYPFIQVKIDTSGLQPVAQRSPGVIAIVGESNAGTADANKPYEVDTLDDALKLFASLDGSGNVVPTTLYSSLEVALLQDPKPSKIYGVKVASGGHAAGLHALEGADDVTFVALAGLTTVGAASTGGSPATGLHLLKEHVENMSASGMKRLGFAMIDPTTPALTDANYTDDVKTAVESLRSDSSRMVLVAARQVDNDAAVASMAAIAGFAPQVSMVLKRVRGLTIPIEARFSASEIKQLSEDGIIPIISPSLIVGGGLYFAEGRTFTSDASLLYVDIVRVLDDIDFRLKAGLIGSIGDARITKSGLTLVKTRTEGILGPLQRNAVIDAFDVSIPVLDILNVPASARSTTDNSIVTTARANRTVDMFVSVTYGPAVHLLLVTLAPTF